MSSANEVLSWTSKDPRQSQLFSSWGVVYRFQTDTNSSGQSVTSLWRAIRHTKEERVAKLEWASGGGLGRATIGKTVVPMADLVRQDPRAYDWRIFNGPDGYQYRWGPSPTDNGGIVLQDPNGHIIARLQNVTPTKYNIGDVFRELHYFRTAGAGVVMHPPLMDTVTVTAMLYQFVTAFGL
ncbi:hypothetical protein BJ322DRAFT_354871 [Thelephora terrestris]|uniref:DUF6593 domain-containing protein n=1 Tax=Thelephora terrestris TaxID=56493 RepID=A0A9P6L2L0_9AGAM|nr:hypothetical protein BJ322DRAFT_354871 [Thelephora terrestris]